MADEQAYAPTCPYCGSGNVATNAKQPASSYCRCEKCGQIWHPERVHQQYQHGISSTFRR